MADETVATATHETTSATAADKKLSPKNKKSRGIDESLVTTWVPFDQHPDLHRTVAHAAAVRGTKVPDMLAEILHKHIQDEHLEAFQSDAEKYEPSTGAGRTIKKLDEMTTEELVAYEARQRATAENAITRAQKAADAARDMLAKARAKQAAARNEAA